MTDNKNTDITVETSVTKTRKINCKLAKEKFTISDLEKTSTQVQCLSLLDSV